MTLIELSGLLLIILIGALALFDGTAEPARSLEFTSDASVPLAVLTGASVAFYALIGFEDSVNVVVETESPSRTFPRALFGGIALVGVVYLLVTFTATMIVDPGRLAGEESAPLGLVLTERPLAFPPQLFSVIALVAITNTALANLIMSSRVLYEMAREGVMPSIFATVHRGRRTLWVAIVFIVLLMLGLVSTGSVGDLANTTVVLLLLVFIVVNAGVHSSERRRSDPAPRPGGPLALYGSRRDPYLRHRDHHSPPRTAGRRHLPAGGDTPPGRARSVRRELLGQARPGPGDAPAAR